VPVAYTALLADVPPAGGFIGVDGQIVW